jgi:CheY-like chemotaxis protein/GAF domain-containing protein
MSMDDNPPDQDQPASSGGEGDRPSPAPQADGGFVYEIRGASPLSPEQRASLGRYVVTQKSGDATMADRALHALGLLGEGAGVVEPTGEITWMNLGLAAQTPEVLRRFADACADTMSAWRRTGGTISTSRANFRSGGKWFEVVMTPVDRSASARRQEGVVALLVDASAARRIQDRLEAIDQAGAALLQFDAESLRKLNAPERLKLLEGKVIAATRSLLGFDHFEYRLTNRKTQQLELVFCSGLVPLGIGERIFARAEGNGLSGVVAATGQSVVCADVSVESRYIGGLPGARSTLTVPLRLHDRIVGVLNAESTEARRFDDEDRLCAELIGRYVALALNILDMLVAERCETIKLTLTNLSDESTVPIEEIAEDARALLARGDAALAPIAERIRTNAARIEELLKNAAAGPSGVLGADEFMREGYRDPIFAGRRVLVADDEAAIRKTVHAVLEQQGCIVSEHADGGGAIAAIRAAVAAGTPFDLVISDVRMPDANGYEVFRATKDASPSTPVILMTAFGYDPNHSIVRSSQEGLHCFLFKPFQIAQLLEEGRKALLS